MMWFIAAGAVGFSAGFVVAAWFTWVKYADVLRRLIESGRELDRLRKFREAVEELLPNRDVLKLMRWDGGYEVVWWDRFNREHRLGGPTIQTALDAAVKARRQAKQQKPEG